jgi:D-sedoheptulose 7-phosphate isomerase
LANDFLYPLSKAKGSGIRVHALTENPAVLTCLGNDEGYENVFSFQLSVSAGAKIPQ